MRTRLVRVVVVLGLALVVAACAPTFADDASLRTSALGSLVRLDWDVATDPDGQAIDRYRIDVDGAQVGLIDAPATSCVLTGLAPTVAYEIVVTAYDTAEEWSGEAEQGRLTRSYTQPTAGAGTAKACVPTTDSDGDRLPNAVETGTGTFVSAGNTGTKPADADSDDDAIEDGDETLGTAAGLNLPALGTAPLKKDLLFEFDWFKDNAQPTICGSHSHRPTATMLARVSTAFANAPVANPDGTRGVHVVADFGQGGAFTGGNLVPDTDGVIAGGVSGADFAAIKNSHFATARRGYFHYTLMPHFYNTNSASSGQAEIHGNDLIVSLGCYGSTTNVANTIMHEVGHNLGLLHGGNVSVPNYKPNYNSVMNYAYQFPGVDTNCTPPGNGVLNYSTGVRATLNESSLSETAGICNGVDVDWNLSGAIDPSPVAADINNADGLFSSLTDYNDWAHLSFHGVGDADGASVAEPQVVTEQPVPHSARR